MLWTLSYVTEQNKGETRFHGVVVEDNNKEKRNRRFH